MRTAQLLQTSTRTIVMKQPIYHVTAVNRLTRQREAVTLPCSKDKATKILKREQKKAPGRRSWIYPKVEEFVPQELPLDFKD